MFKMFSNRDNFMKELQEKIYRGESVLVIITEIEEMDIHRNPLESINTLFSITE